MTAIIAIVLKCVSGDTRYLPSLVKFMSLACQITLCRRRFGKPKALLLKE